MEICIEILEFASLGESIKTLPWDKNHIIYTAILLLFTLLIAFPKVIRYLANEREYNCIQFVTICSQSILISSDLT